jgi:hypothetical protein
MNTVGNVETGSTQKAEARANDEPISPWPRRILLACDGSRHSAKAANIVAAMVFTWVKGSGHHGAKLRIRCLHG